MNAHKVLVVLMARAEHNAGYNFYPKLFAGCFSFNQAVNGIVVGNAQYAQAALNRKLNQFGG